jgi:hypothetical protein
MVTGNHGHGRVRVGAESATPPPPITGNADAAALAVGDEVVPNYADAAARARHVPGVIIGLDQGRARVRWKPGDRTEWLPVRNLVKR